MPNDRAKRTLVRWKDDHDKELLLWIVHVCAESGIRIPFDKVAWCMGENFSEGAVTQHLAKLRTKSHNESLHVPNAPKRRMNPNIKKYPALRGVSPVAQSKLSKEDSDDMSHHRRARPVAAAKHYRIKQEVEEEDMANGNDHDIWTNDPEEDYERARKRQRRTKNPFRRSSEVTKSRQQSRAGRSCTNRADARNSEVDSEEEEEEVVHAYQSGFPAFFNGIDYSRGKHALQTTNDVAENPALTHNFSQPLPAPSTAMFGDYAFSQHFPATQFADDQAIHPYHAPPLHNLPHAFDHSALSGSSGSYSQLINSSDSGDYQTSSNSHVDVAQNAFPSNMPYQTNPGHFDLDFTFPAMF